MFNDEGEAGAEPVTTTETPTEKTIPYSRFQDVNTKFKDTQDQLGLAQQQITDLTTKLESAISKDDFETFKTETQTTYDKQINDIKIDNALRTEIYKSGVKVDTEKGIDYTNMVLNSIDRQGLSLNDKGEVVGTNGILLRR